MTPPCIKLDAGESMYLQTPQGVFMLTIKADGDNGLQVQPVASTEQLNETFNALDNLVTRER